MFWPLRRGRIVTSPFGPRDAEFHTGVDFGFPGGSASAPVYAVDAGVVRYSGAADGYGGPDPAGWIVVESPSGCWEYGHVRRCPQIRVGARVEAGEQIAIVNPDSETNGGTAPHLHVSFMPRGYNPDQKIDPLPALAGAADPGGTVSDNRPEFNEYAMWSGNNSDRDGTPIDLWILHTQQGAGNADSLARYLCGPSGVSYHYTVSQAADGGVTVCDVVDTDLAAWSVLDANRRSINLCFAGSFAEWSRSQWLAQSKAIDTAAYLCVQDSKKYGIPLKVMPPGNYGPPPGISDHRYVSDYLKVGNHTDVGNGFPWDYFVSRIAAYANPAPAPAPAPKPPAPPAPPAPLTDRQLLERIDAKLDRILAR